MNKDEIYKQPLQNIEDFTFDQSVSDAFDDMVDRSVPGYRTLIANIGPIAAHFLRENTYCYDLGCSHGAAALSVFNHRQTNALTINAVDNSPAMIERCNMLIEQAGAKKLIKTLQEDISETSIHQASVVILNLTLQFLPINKRKDLLKKIYRGLIDGGACILTEKIVLKNEKHEKIFQELHTNFKSANQYSELEISQKRKALENVLIRETLESHEKRLKDIGFSDVVIWFQCINFVSLLAIK